jgi:hypothetical protein
MVFLVVVVLCPYFLFLFLLLFLLLLFFLILVSILVVTLTSRVLILVRLSFLVYIGEELVELLLSLPIVITSWRSCTFHLFLT